MRAAAWTLVKKRSLVASSGKSGMSSCASAAFRVDEEQLAHLPTPAQWIRCCGIEEPGRRMGVDPNPKASDERKRPERSGAMHRQLCRYPSPESGPDHVGTTQGQRLVGRRTQDVVLDVVTAASSADH